MSRLAKHSSIKEKKFNTVLKSAKRALDSINVPFHLHAGTALGCHREHSFIAHDHDIDLAVFYKDVNTSTKVKDIEKAMKKEGFEIVQRFGRINRGKEIQFKLNGVPLDIFWVYEGLYNNTSYYIIHSYFGECDTFKHKTCVWGYRPYKTAKMIFLGERYNVIPASTLVDCYGSDWRVPKKFGYFDGITTGSYKGILRDYYDQ